MYGVNQAECCDGETASAAPLRTSDIAAAPERGAPDSPAPPKETPSTICSTARGVLPHRQPHLTSPAAANARTAHADATAPEGQLALGVTPARTLPEPRRAQDAHHFAHHLGVTTWTPRYPAVTIFSGKEPLRTSQTRLSSRWRGRGRGSNRANGRVLPNAHRPSRPAAAGLLFGEAVEPDVLHRQGPRLACGLSTRPEQVFLGTCGQRGMEGDGFRLEGCDG